MRCLSSPMEFLKQKQKKKNGNKNILAAETLLP